MEVGLSQKEILILIFLVVFLFIPAGIIAIDLLWNNFQEQVR